MSDHILPRPSDSREPVYLDPSKSEFTSNISGKPALLKNLRNEIARIEEKPATWFEGQHSSDGRSGSRPSHPLKSGRQGRVRGRWVNGNAKDSFPNKANSSGYKSAFDTVRKTFSATRCEEETLSLGDDTIDEALGGGFPVKGLTELHGEETRDTGGLTGFALALAGRLGASRERPVLWITERPALYEAGFPYPAAFGAFAVDPGGLTLVAARRLEDAVWAAEEAASCSALSLVVLEVRGNPRLVGLEGTRRLHLRSRKASVPLLLIRQSGRAEATAAPLRFRIGPNPALPVSDIKNQPRLIGAPVFRLAVEKNRFAPPCQLDLAWSSHDRSFFNAASGSGQPLSGARNAQASHRPDHPRSSGTGMALGLTG